MYDHQIMEHYKFPQNNKELKRPTIRISDHNPSCGDEIILDLKIEKDKIVDVGFHGKGCAISQAAASMLTEEIKGKSVSQLENLTKEKMLEIIGTELSMLRVKCGLLAWSAMKKGLFKLKHKEVKNT